MPSPKLTPDEQFLVNSVKSPKHEATSGSYMWAYLLSSILLGGIGTYYASAPILVSALVVLCGLRIYEEWYARKWLPLWRSVMEKYEQAANNATANNATANNATANNATEADATTAEPDAEGRV